MANKEENLRASVNDVAFNNSSARALQGQKSGSAYDISVVKFPSDLGSADLLHYVQFAINVRGKSKFNYTKKLGTSQPPENRAKLTPDEIGNVKAVGAAAGGLAAGVAVTALADTVLKKLNVSGAISKKIPITPGQAVGAAAGLGVFNAMQESEILKSDTTERISDVIALHVDGPPTVKYAMQYSNKDLGTMAGVVGSLGSSVSTADAFSKVPDIAAAVGMQFAKLPGALGGTDLGAAIGKAAGVALNPFREVIFEAVDFRTFAFKYKFLPKNKTESDSIKRIINLFKFHMHPEIASSKLFFIYPSEFQITYFFKGKQNEYFHKFRPCVLDSMEVNYGGEQFSSFKDGQPSEVNMSLVFRETEVLTKELVNKGY
jgi:hypothetical protein